MTQVRRWPVAAAFALIVIVAGAPEAAAHGVGGRSDLPLPLWQVVWAAAAAVVVSFAALGVLWTRPRLAGLAEGRPIGGGPVLAVAEGLGRAALLVIFVVMIAAGIAGPANASDNPTPFGVYVIFWVLVQVAVALIGGLWRQVDPLDTIARVVERVSSADRSAEDIPWWPAAAGLFGFLWLELAYHDPASPRLLGWLLLGYTVVNMVAVVRYGRGWLARAEGFGVMFGLIAALAPITVDDTGRWRLRAPMSGLAELSGDRRTTAVVLTVLGGTTFDGLTRSAIWNDLAGDRFGWSRTVFNTAGLVWAIAMVGLVYLLGSRLGATLTPLGDRAFADLFAPTLVPIMLAYAVAHYFSLLVFEGQNFWINLADPFGLGWNLNGAAGNSVDFLVVSTALIAWVQVLAIVIGHVVAVLAAHDRALENFDHGVVLRSQYPMLVVMVSYTVVGLLLLLNG